MATSPSTDLYSLGKGILSFDRFDADGLPTGMRDLGNAPAFTIAVAIETLDHFSSRSGIKKKDKSVVLSAGLTAKFTLEEYDKENLALALFGDVSGNVITLLSQTKVEGQLKFVGNPSVGPAFQVDLWKVALKPTGEMPFIGDDWGKIEFEVEVQSDDSGHPASPYGTITEIVSS